MGAKGWMGAATFLCRGPGRGGADREKVAWRSVVYRFYSGCIPVVFRLFAGCSSFSTSAVLHDTQPRSKAPLGRWFSAARPPAQLGSSASAD